MKKSRKKKRLFAAATLLLCAIMMAGGTYAWTDYSQNAVNRFTGQVSHDVTLHDDFDGENKDVYVENTGESPMYVRVQIAEYMQIGNYNMLGQDLSTAHNSSVELASTETIVTANTRELWVIHTYCQDDTTTVEDCGLAKGTDGGIQFHSYYTWNMSGRQRKYVRGTPGLVSSVLNGVQTDDDGAVVYDEFGQAIKVVDENEGEKDTLPTAKPVTMTYYTSLLDKQQADADSLSEAEKEILSIGRWVLDADGWAYWSQALKPDTATNLLLDGVTLRDDTSTPPDTWYYVVDARLQAVSLNEVRSTWQYVGPDEDTTSQSTAMADKLFDNWRRLGGLL